MKLLIAIQNTFPGNNASLPFTFAWKNFVERYKNKFINIDFVFVNNGLDNILFDNLLVGHKTTHVFTPPYKFLWDTDNSYHAIGKFYNEYDYIMRIDNDAFPEPDSIETIYNFLLKHSEVDFVSANNYPRIIISAEDSRDLKLDDRNVAGTEFTKINWPWLPWKYPTTNSDMYIFKTSFFKKALDKYNNCPLIQKSPSPHTPFHSTSLRYKDICTLLNYTETRFNVEENNIRLSTDGGINTDFGQLCVA